jgi:predicted ATP-dependent serine protease
MLEATFETNMGSRDIATTVWTITHFAVRTSRTEVTNLGVISMTSWSDFLKKMVTGFQIVIIDSIQIARPFLQISSSLVNPPSCTTPP